MQHSVVEVGLQNIFKAINFYEPGQNKTECQN